MHDSSIELEPSLDWIESSSAKAWARSELPLEPIPGFGSLARRELQQSIADDEAEIMRLEDAIRDLRHRVGRNRARLAPIRLVPNETLSAIFLDWLHLRDLPKTTVRGYFVPPSTIMEVCRRWTACAISTPAIWSHGKFSIDTSDIACVDRARMFKTLSGRAGSHNLKVYFGGSDEHEIADKVWCEVMEPLLFRMDDLTICGLGIGYWQDYLEPEYEWPDQKIVTSLTICSRLSQLNLYGIDFPASESQAPIVLPTVRNMAYERCKGNPPIQCPDLVYCIVQACSLSHSYSLSLSSSSPLLDTVFLHGNYQNRGQVTSQPTFLRLRHLVIEGHSDLSIPEWFSDAPNLSTLDLYLSHYSFEAVIEVMWLSSPSALTSLTLSMAFSMAIMGDEDVQILLEWMVRAHNLVELRLTFESNAIVLDKVSGMERFIEPLLTSKLKPACFPHLKHITIEGDRQLEKALLQLLVDRATNAERMEAGFPPCEIASGIVQRPCRLTLVDSCTLPNMKSVGLKEFLDICQKEALRDAVQMPDEVE